MVVWPVTSADTNLAGMRPAETSTVPDAESAITGTSIVSAVASGTTVIDAAGITMKATTATSATMASPPMADTRLLTGGRATTLGRSWYLRRMSSLRNDSRLP